MNPAYTILMNPHLINNIVFKNKGLQSPTAKIMRDFFRDYDHDLVNIGFDEMMDEKVSEHFIKVFSKEKLINMIKEGHFHYYNDIAYHTYYFDNREQ